MKKTAIVTGATSGIGEATARILANNNYNLIITGRRLTRLEKLKSDITSTAQCEVQILHFDIRSLSETEQAIDSLPDNWKKIDLLVNNAGLAVGLNPIQEGDIDDWERMISTNINGLLYVTRKIAPMMIANGSGHIINITSIAGKDVYPNGNVYCATKSAVESLTKGMRMDLVKHNIKVTSIAPGMVETEFSVVRFKGDEKRAETFYDGFVPLCAEDVAEAILFAATRPPHVNINDLLIMPMAQASGNITYRNK